MSLKEKLSGSAAVLRELWFLARPYSLAKPAFLLLVILLQGVLQVAGVTSIFPFLALAADPESFRASKLGSLVLGKLPPMDNAKLLIWAGVLSIVILALSNAANLLSDYVRSRYGHSLGHWLRLKVLEQMASRPWSYFLTQNTGVLIKKANNDVINMVSYVLLPILEAVARFVTACLLVLTLLMVDYKVAITAAIVLTVYYLVVLKVLHSFRTSLSEAWAKADRGAIREVQQLLGGIKTVKLHHAEQFFIKRYADHSRVIADVNSKTPLHYHTPKYLLEPVAFGGVILTVILYAAGGKSLGEIIPTLGVVGLAGYRLLPAMQLLYAQIAQVGTSRHYLTEVYDEFHNISVFRQGSAHEQFASDIKPLVWQKSIVLDDVSFRYAGAGKDTLHKLNLEITRNSSLGIVGSTGSGKSTLVDLLMGLHEPTEGRIKVDGIVLDRGNMRAWQAGIGYVPQDIFLIDDTVTRNIALGVPDSEIDHDRVRWAAEAASIASFIEHEMRDGYNSVVGERGVRLSGGQRQRIALARAIYRKPELLILDEATSALDNETEAQVVQAINNLQGQITMVVIAHRLSTIDKCSMVVELEAGQLTHRR
ncbi:MAG: ABC transporter ATP-binding protein [Chthoniobacterales bacterium]